MLGVVGGDIYGWEGERMDKGNKERRDIEGSTGEGNGAETVSAFLYSF